MSTASRSFNQLPAPVKRLLLATGLLTLFLGVSAVLNPDRSLADAKANFSYEENARAFEAAKAMKAQAQPNPIIPVNTSTRPLLGTLVGSPYHIWVYAGNNGPLYTVADQTGKILCTEVTAEELYDQVPGASVDKLQLKTLTEGTNVMVVPDRRD